MTYYTIMAIENCNIQQQINLVNNMEKEVTHKRINTASLYLNKFSKQTNIIMLKIKNGDYCCGGE